MRDQKIREGDKIGDLGNIGRTINEWFVKLATELVMGRDLYKMFRWINKHDAVFIKDMEVFRKEYSNLTGLGHGQNFISNS